MSSGKVLEKESKPEESKKPTCESSEEKLQVHSANSWETAELGDDGRKNKFLRLMGAAKKKDHHGKIIIGDHSTTHARSKNDTDKMTTDLESQYQQGLAFKLSGSARAHKGFGFEEEKPTEKPEEKPDSDNKDTNNDNSDKKEQSVDNSSEPEKRKFSENPPSKDNEPSSEKKMKFVKSSS